MPNYASRRDLTPLVDPSTFVDRSGSLPPLDRKSNPSPDPISEGLIELKKQLPKEIYSQNKREDYHSPPSVHKTFTTMRGEFKRMTDPNVPKYQYPGHSEFAKPDNTGSPYPA